MAVFRVADTAFASRHPWLGLALWLLIPFAAAATGVVWAPGSWYAELEKPSWNPPAAWFGPVWTALYLLMGFAAWRVWRRGGFGGAPRALAAFFVQLGLNALWTPVFFGLHAMGGALAVILALWLAIVVTMALFWKHDRTASLLLAPYLAWVTFATVLNATLLALN